MNYDYRQESDKKPSMNEFALVILLPEDLDAVIAPLRERFDPDYNIISSHITVVPPFETEKDIHEVAQIIQSETEQVANLTLELGSIGDYYPDFPVICWNVKKNEILNRLFTNLHGKLDLALPCRGFAPHVTIAKEISSHRVMIIKEKIISYLSSETLSVGAIDLVAPVAGQNWLSVRTFPLEKAY